MDDIEGMREKNMMEMLEKVKGIFYNLEERKRKLMKRYMRSMFVVM